jgi:PGF-pre-PGF domain-containing protein
MRDLEMVIKLLVAIVAFLLILSITANAADVGTTARVVVCNANVPPTIDNVVTDINWEGNEYSIGDTLFIDISVEASDNNSVYDINDVFVILYKQNLSTGELIWKNETNLTSFTNINWSTRIYEGTLVYGGYLPGSYVLEVQVSDNSGAFDSEQFSILKETSVLTETSVSSSSGGGGGSSGEDGNNIKNSMLTRVYLMESEPALYLFEDVTVDSIRVIPKGTYGLIPGMVEVLHGPSSQIGDSELPDGEINQFLNIYMRYDRWAEGRLSEIIINFRVPYHWFAENDIDPAKLTMYCFHEGEWHPLETTLNGQDGEYYLFSSLTPGFSSFAIIGQTEQVTSATPVISDDGIFDIAASPEPQTAENQKSPGFSFGLVVIGIGVALSRIKK